MKKKTMMALCLALIAAVAASPAYSLQKEDNQALLKEISGTWEFTSGYDILEVRFFVENGILKGAEVSDEQAVDCEQDETNKMLFRGFTPDGEAFEVEFFKDEEGQITKSKLIIGYNEVEGTKIKAG
jgi:hypothetical protein